MRAYIATVVARDMARDFHRAQVQLHLADGTRRLGRQHVDRGLGPDLCVLVAVRGLDDRGAIVEIERLHAVRLTLVQIDRAGVDCLERARPVDGADEPAVGVGDAVFLGRARAQPDAGRGRAPPGPHRSPVAEHQTVIEDQPPHAFAEILAPPPLVVEAQRRFIRRAREVWEQHERVRQVHDRRLGRTGEHLTGVSHQPLIELIGSGHEHGQRALRGAPRPSRLLAKRSDRSGETVDHARVEPADVDAELEGARGDDAGKTAVEQLGLDLPALGREVAASVGTHLVREVVADLSSDCARDDLCGLAAPTERDRARALLEQRRREGGGLDVRRATSSRLDVEQGWVPQRKEPFAVWRPVVEHRVHR